MTARDIDIMLQRQQAMQRAKLRQNEHKGCWRGDDLALLLFRLYEEADELKAEASRLMDLQRQGAKALLSKQALAVMHEAADVANFAGFIIDKLWGKEKPRPTFKLEPGAFGPSKIADAMPQGVKDAIAESVRSGEPLRILNADGSVHTIEPMQFDHQPAPGDGDTIGGVPFVVDDSIGDCAGWHTIYYTTDPKDES